MTVREPLNRSGVYALAQGDSLSEPPPDARNASTILVTTTVATPALAPAAASAYSVRMSDPDEAAAQAAFASDAAAFVPRGARVALIGAWSDALSAAMPYGVCLIPVSAEDATQARPDLVIVMRPLDAAGLDAQLCELACVGTPILVRCAPGGALGPEQGGAVFSRIIQVHGFKRAHGKRTADGSLLLRLERDAATPRKEKVVWVVSFKYAGNFGDRLGVHVLSHLLPPHAVVHHIDRPPFEAPPTGSPDLLIMGLGNSFDDYLLTPSLMALLNRAPRSIGIFGTAGRESLPRDRMDLVLDRLESWWARSEEDLLLFGRSRGNVRHLGDWLIDAFPMARPTRNETLEVGDEALHNQPLDRYISHLQSFRRVFSPRLHTLLCAMTSAEQVAYEEQLDPYGYKSGKFRSLLLDVFGREYPERRFWSVDRDAVQSYKLRVARNLEDLRAELSRLL